MLRGYLLFMATYLGFLPFAEAQLSVTSVPPVTADSIKLCLSQNTSINYSASFIGTSTAINWVFHGGTPGTASGNGPHSVSYSGTGIDSTTVTVFNNTTVVATRKIYVQKASQASPSLNPSKTIFCSNDPVFQIDGASPPGGYFIGPGVSNGNFNPAGAGTGNKTISYVIDNGVCQDTTSVVFNVKSAPQAEFIGPGIPIQFNGVSVYYHCPPTLTHTFFFNNQSSNYDSYILNYGDGTIVSGNSSWNILSHTYTAPGLYTVILDLAKANGCTDSDTVYVFYGSNPGGQIANPGNTTLYCLDSISGSYTLTFPISNTQNNDPGTIYNVYFSDNNNTVTYSHPPPDTIFHTYTQSSCGFNSQSFRNSFYILFNAQNPCGSSAPSIDPINISSPPTAEFIAPDRACVNGGVTITNTSDPGANVYFDPNITAPSGLLGDYACDSSSIFVWEISPATYTVTSGSLGFRNAPDPSTGFPGTKTLDVQFNQAGTYTVKLIIAGSSSCGIDSLEKQICIDTIPQAGFTMAADTICRGSPLNAFYNSPLLSVCDSLDLTWTIDPDSHYIQQSSTAGDSAMTWLFNRSGSYTVSLAANNVCGTVAANLPLVVAGPPSLVMPAGLNLCGLTTVDFGDSLYQPIVYDSLVPVSYQWSVSPAAGWSFLNGTGDSSLAPVIDFTQFGTYTVSLTVANKCGSATEQVVFNLSPGPQLQALNDTTVCYGASASFSLIATNGNFPYDYFWGYPGGGITDSGATLVLNNLTADTTLMAYVVDQNGCSDTQSVVITVLPEIIVDLGTNIQVCYSDTVQLSSSISGGLGQLSYSWAPIAGLDSATIANPRAYPDSTSRTYVLTVTDSVGCQGIDSLRIDPFPLAVVHAGPDTTVCTSSPVISISGFSPPGGSWSGTGILNGQNQFDPAVAGLGAHQVFYHYTDANGCAYQDSLLVQVIPSPVSNFSLSDSMGCSPFAVTLSDSSTPGVSHQWFVNGVLISTQANPLITLTNTGTIQDSNFTILLVVTDGSGCVDSLPKLVTVYPQPGIGFSIPPITCGADTLTLTNTTTVKQPATYLWSASSASVWISDTTAGAPSVSFPDNQSGSDSTYVLSLVVTSADGCTDTLSQNITIYSRPVANFSLPTNACAPVLLSPIDSSTGAGLIYNWSISPATNVVVSGAMTPNPSFQIPPVSVDSTTYVISLTIQDSRGCVDSIALPYTVYPKPTAAFMPSQTDSCGPLTVNFTNNSTSGLTGMGQNTMTFNWDFGNGTSSVAAAPSATFTNTGILDSTYIVSLIATNAFGCSDTISDTLLIRAKPIAQLVIEDSAECAPFVMDTASVTALNVGYPPTAFQWQVVDIASGLVIQSFAGLNALNYTLTTPSDSVVIRLIVSAASCAPDTAEAIFFTLPDPPDLVLTDSTGCSPVILLLDSTATGVSYRWFVDGVLQSTQANPGIALTNTGAVQDSTFNVSVVATAGAGCTDSISVPVTVYPHPIAGFSFLDVCETDTVAFFDTSLGVDSTVSWLWDFGDGTTSNLPNPRHFYNTSGVKVVSLTVSDRRGCSATATDTVFVYPNPQASFTRVSTCGTDTVCVGIPVQFNDSSHVDSLGAPINSWAWDMGADGTVDYLIQDPTHVFQDTGLVSVSLRIQTASGCVDSITRQLFVIDAPIAAFAFDTTGSCGPLTVNPIDSSTGFIQQYNWRVYVLDSLGNPLTIFQSTSRAPSGFPTLQAGLNDDTTYYFELVVANCCGIDTATKSITLTPQPVAGILVFSLFQLGCDSLLAKFRLDGLVKGNPTYLVLNFGDGTPDSTLYPTPQMVGGDTVWIWGQPSHWFYNPSPNDTTYTVTLTAYNACGTSTDQVSVSLSTLQVQAFMQTSLISGCEPLTVTFVDSSFGATSMSWCLDYDPVTKSCKPAAPVASGSSVTHTFQNAGTYHVRLIVTDQEQCSFDTIVQTITVNPAPLAQFTSNNYVCAGDSISFIDQSTITNGLISSYQWYFGDGDSSNLTSPAHVYAAGGNYTVTLIITSSTGCQDSVQSSVSIYDKPSIDFGWTDACFNAQPVQFFDSSFVVSGSINSTSWNFGDGNTSAAANPLHTYAAPGTYKVTLIHSSTNGCIDSAFRMINVYPEPTANYSYTHTGSDSCSLPQTIQFNQQASGAIGYQWDFDYANNRGVNTSTLANPSFTFSNYGVYDVALFTVNQFGCEDSIIKQIYIRPAPLAGFTADSLEGCEPLNVRFQDTSTVDFNGPGGINSWMWLFGDGSTSSLQNPTHTYTTAGSYTVTLVITTDGGCRDSIVYEQYINVYPTPVAQFNIEQISALEYRFVNTSANTDAGTQYLWTFGDGTTAAEASTTHRYVLDLTRDSASYIICLQVINGFSCRDSTCIALSLRSLQLNVPNAFAPEVNNGFDANIFLPKGHSLKSYTLTIFDKWGNIVFQTAELDEEGKPAVGWDGTHYQNGTPLPMGAYTWRIDAVFDEGTVWLGKKYTNGTRRNVGSVTLIR
jgi:PKD repeat protein